VATILAIDDDPVVIQLLEYTLRRAGHQVFSAKDGQAGLAMTETERPDLVIADVMMPRLNGYEYCRRVRAQPDMAHIPILIFSARFQQVDQQTAMEAGATAYMGKIVDPSEIVAQVEKLLSTAQAAPEARLGSVIALFSLHGGVGVTTLAVNLAVAAAFSRREPAALVDMAPLAGHAAMMLGLPSTGGLRKSLEKADRIGVEALRPYWQAHASGVQVLSSPLEPGEAGEISPSAVHPLVASLRQAFPFAFLDLPPTLSQTTTAALAAADRVLLVLTPDVTALQSAAVALQAMSLAGVSNERIWLVLNAPGGPGLSPETITQALKRPLAAAIPYEPGMLPAVNERRPLILSGSKSAGVQAIARLAAQLMGG
jgi:pilus assembly protein CpaE